MLKFERLFYLAALIARHTHYTVLQCRHSPVPALTSASTSSPVPALTSASTSSPVPALTSASTSSPVPALTVPALAHQCQHSPVPALHYSLPIYVSPHDSIKITSAPSYLFTQIRPWIQCHGWVAISRGENSENNPNPSSADQLINPRLGLVLN